MVVPPPRDVPGDLYADAHSIPYEDGRMTCDGVVWQYRIYHPSTPPTHQFGTIGDIAYIPDHEGPGGNEGNSKNGVHDTRVWYRAAKDWMVADPTLGAHGIPKQKHPLLKGKYRLDGRTRRWRGTTTYYYLGAAEKKKNMKKEKEKMKAKKGRLGDVDVDGDVDGHEETGEAIKVEPSETHLSVHEEWDNGSRQTGWIDLSNTPESEQIPSASSFSAPATTRSGLKLIPIPYEPTTTRGQVVPSSILQPLEGQGPPHSASSTTTAPHMPPGDGGPTFLHGLEGMNFHYPTFSGLGLGLGLGLAGSSSVPPPRSVREFGVQTDNVSEVNVSGQDPFGGTTPGVVPLTPTSPMLVHHSDRMITTRPPSVQNAVSLSSSTSTSTTHSHSHANHQLESGSSTDSDSASDDFQSRRVESLLERILLESANDRKDILGVIRTMNERLEAIERLGKQIQPSEGLTVPPPPSQSSSSSTSPLAKASSSVVGASREVNVPTTLTPGTTTPTMTQAAVPVPTSTMTAANGYVRPSLPLPKRYLKECRARKLGEDAVTGSGTVNANAGPNMTMTKRKVPDESGFRGILEDEDGDGVRGGVVKKSRFSARS